MTGTEPNHFVENLPPHRTRKILLVDDEDAARLMTKWFLGSFEYDVDSVRNAQEALALFDPAIHDLVITDNRMPGMTGVEMAHIIKSRSPSTPVIMYSGQPSDDQSCLDATIVRPTHLLNLKEAVDRLLS